jgi:hypothetical protein
MRKIIPELKCFLSFCGKLYPDLNGLKGWLDKKLIFNGLEATCFHNYFALTIAI